MNPFAVPTQCKIKQPVPEYLLRISGAKLLVSIKYDGTVVIHELGAEKEAAKIFYEALEINGKSLVARIAALEAELANHHA